MVSVIIPTYKRSTYIERSIESVLNQTYKDYEIIVVDDNDPNTEDRKKNEEKMKKYEKLNNFTYIKHEKNKNGAAARNTGIKIAKGDYITFLDDDDIFFNKRLEILVDNMQKNPEFEAAYTSTVIIKDKKIANLVEAKKSGELKQELLMQKSFIGTGSNMFFKAEILKEIKGFDETFIRHQDLEILIRYFRKYKILAVDEVLVLKDDSNSINVPNIEKAFKIREYFLDVFKDDISQYDNKSKIYAKNYFDLYIQACINNNHDYKKICKNKIKEYDKIDLKMKIRILYKIILSNKITNKVIVKIKDFMFRKKLDNEKIELIEKMLIGGN